MDSLLVQPTDAGSSSFSVSPDISAKAYADAAALDSLSTPVYGEDKVDISFEDLYKSLSLTARKVIDRLNELLQGTLPNGVQSLKADEWTPEATSDRIVSQVTALFSSYAKRHPDLEGEDLLNGFMDTIRSGVQSGYDDAFGTLDSLGAFDFEGVQSGVEKTKQLIDEKLDQYEANMRKQLGIDSEDVSAESIAPTVSSDLLAQGGVYTLDIAA